jgi:hypothetical protein
VSDAPKFQHSNLAADLPDLDGSRRLLGDV